MRQETLFTLDAAMVSLYPTRPASETRTNPWGEADTDHPVMLGCEANSLRLIHRHEELPIRPTGARHPITKHLNSEHVIEMNRLWVTRPDLTDDTAADDYEMERNRQFVLTIAWQQAPPVPLAEARWKARIYFGVKMSVFDLASNEMVSFLGDQALRAEFFRTDKGVGVLPADYAGSREGVTTP